MLRADAIKFRWPAVFLRVGGAEDRENFMAIKAELDAIDLKILRELQKDGRMTNVDLSERVGHHAQGVQVANCKCFCWYVFFYQLPFSCR